MTLVKYAVTAALWLELFNVSVVFVHYRFDLDQVVRHWYELVFFPFTLLYRWVAHVTEGALRPADGQCTWYQKLLLGDAYCSKLAKAAATIRKVHPTQDQRDAVVAAFQECNGSV